MKKTKSKTKEDNVFNFQDNKSDKIESMSAQMLSHGTIQDGMNIMGLVKDVESLYLTISLPGRIDARVSALEVSESYTKSTKEFLQSEGNSSGGSDFKPLKELFSSGQLIYGKVGNEIVEKFIFYKFILPTGGGNCQDHSRKNQNKFQSETLSGSLRTAAHHDPQRLHFPGSH